MRIFPDLTRVLPTHQDAPIADVELASKIAALSVHVMATNDCLRDEDQFVPSPGRLAANPWIWTPAKVNVE